MSDTENELSGLSASYSCTVARPLSTDSSLKSLSVEGYTLQPEFSPSITEYVIEGEVEYTLSALKINTKANDSEASVEISGSRLSVGNNTIRVKVTAENDSSTTTYIIKAKMMQDPNYVASSDASLSLVTLSEGRLSPSFSPEKHDYIVYVPYEVLEMTVGCTPSDPKTNVETEGEKQLSVGENVFIIRCTAEDGTVSEYKVTVMRMDEYLEEPESEEYTEIESEDEPDTEEDTEEESESDLESESEEYTEEEITETEETKETDETEPETETLSEDNSNVFTRKIPLWAVLAAAVGGIAIGALGSVFIINSLKERK